MATRTKALRVIGLVLTVYALLVATHRGEFWPFSIYPMFSQAGNPWTRALVREMPPDTTPDSLEWAMTTLEDLPGKAYPLAPQNIHQNDVSNYISKAGKWTDDRVQGLRSMFTKGRPLAAPLLVLRARGKLVEDSVMVTVTPVVMFGPDTTHLNPVPEARLPGNTVANPSSVD